MPLWLQHVTSQWKNGRLEATDKIGLPFSYANEIYSRAERGPPGSDSTGNEVLVHSVIFSLDHTVGGRNPLRSTLNPWETSVCWYLRGGHHCRIS